MSFATTCTLGDDEVGGSLRDARAAPNKKWTSRSISRILSRPLPAGAIIHLRPLLPVAWCDLPGDSGEQPSGASADAYAPF